MPYPSFTKFYAEWIEFRDNMLIAVNKLEKSIHHIYARTKPRAKQNLWKAIKNEGSKFLYIGGQAIIVSTVLEQILQSQAQITAALETDIISIIENVEESKVEVEETINKIEASTIDTIYKES
nr:hypothetical protein [Ostreobium quekettii]